MGCSRGPKSIMSCGMALWQKSTSLLPGDEVATITRSTSSGETPVPSSARIAAVDAKSWRPVPSGSRWREEIPVRSDIHSSFVSSPINSRSAFGITCGAAHAPTPNGLDLRFDFPGFGHDEVSAAAASDFTSAASVAAS